MRNKIIGAYKGAWADHRKKIFRSYALSFLVSLLSLPLLAGMVMMAAIGARDFGKGAIDGIAYLIQYGWVPIIYAVFVFPFIYSANKNKAVKTIVFVIGHVLLFGGFLFIITILSLVSWMLFFH